MVENRPDWCISRQRLWGVPITVYYCANCKTEVLTKDMLDHLVKLVEANGADIWFEKEAKELMPKDSTCPHCQSSEFTKETNILDVWFDSGVTHAAVLEKEKICSRPRICIWKVPTSIAAGSIPLFWSPWEPEDARPT